MSDNSRFVKKIVDCISRDWRGNYLKVKTNKFHGNLWFSEPMFVGGVSPHPRFGDIYNNSENVWGNRKGGLMSLIIPFKPILFNKVIRECEVSKHVFTEA